MMTFIKARASHDTALIGPALGWAAAICVLLLAPLARAQQGTSSQAEALVREAVRRFAEETGHGQGAGPGAGVAVQPAAGASHPALPLAIDAAVKMALERNMDIAVQRSAPPMAALSAQGARAAYLPTFTSTLSDQRQVAPPLTLLTGGERVRTTTTLFDTALAQNVPVGGGRIDLTWNNDRVTTNSIFYNFSPAYDTNLSLQYTQPLLRGRRTDAAREQITVTKLNQQVSDLQLQATIVNILSNVRGAYWDLVLAVESVRVAKETVDLARKLVEEDQVRVKFGTMTRLDLATALAQEASSRHALVQAEGNRRIAELALKQLIVGGPQDPVWQAVIEPTDRPEAAAAPVDIEAAVRRALRERTDLESARRQVEANRAAYALLRDQALPQANLVASYSAAGVGGTELIRTGNFLSTQVVGTIPGGFGDALHTMAVRDFPTWTVGATFAYPFGFNAAKAAAARAKIQVAQADAQLRQMEVQAVTEVTNAGIRGQNSLDEVSAAGTARELAQQRLDAEQKKFQAGVSTNYLVVQAQRDLADARNAELQAQVNYRKAIVAFERAQQATLQAMGITLVSAGGTATQPPPGGPAPGSQP